MATWILGSALTAMALAIAATLLLLSLAGHDISPEEPPEGYSSEMATLAFEWSDGPALLQPRAYPAVVVLGDGRIAVMGGVTASGITSSTEVFDPELWSWRPGPNMLSKRIGHTAHLLSDGRVYVFGGDTGSGATSSVEVIDFSLGYSTQLPRMYFARTGHSSVVLLDGRVLVAGGTDWKTGVWREAEVYDPLTRTWSPAGSMSHARLFACAEVLRDGSVLMAGGDTDGTSEVFDPGTTTWGSVSKMSVKRARASSVTLGDGRVMVAGGLAGDAPLRSVEAYDPPSKVWSPAGDMSEPRASFSLVKLTDGVVLASGSYSKLGTVASADLFCPQNSTLFRTYPMSVSRGAHGSAITPDGRAIVFGGYSGVSLTPTTEVFAQMPPEEPQYCQPIHLLPLVLDLDEVPGHSKLGFIAKMFAAQAKYDIGDHETCIDIMNAFYHQVRAFAQSGHMTHEHAVLIYDAYASVVTCIGGTPLPPFPDMVP